MTDKVQKIREKVVEIVNSINLFAPDEDGKNSSYEEGRLVMASQILQIIDSLEEPVNIDFEQELYKAFGQVKDFTLGMRIAKWFYDMGKNSQEPVSEELEEAAWQYYDRNKPLMPPELDLHKELIVFFKAGARWKEQNDSNLSEVLDRDNLDEMAEEYSSCTYLEEVLGEGDREVLKARLKNTFKAGARWEITKLMKDATEVTVHIDAGGYPYISEIELYDYDKDVPLAKEGDKYKVVLIKED